MKFFRGLRLICCMISLLGCYAIADAQNGGFVSTKGSEVVLTRIQIKTV